ncbi:MAG: TonB-dependent receptor [bacterium]|nr:TonB-dependent receptor [Candidatus Kapabacteria bacterium]
MPLGEIAITPTAADIGGVIVRGERDFMTVEIDRNVYRTDDMPVAAGGNASDVLRNIPSVEVDVDGNVSLRGNQNVAVQINGRPVMMSGDALANYLQTLSAGSIERVEVIANPSARYDPEGMGGILNIELKKGAEQGLTGGINAGIGTNDSYSAGANINYGSGPWNISATYGLNTRTRDMYGYRLQIDRATEIGSTLTVRDTGTSSSLGHSVNASVEYALDNMNAITLATRFGMRGGDDLRTSQTVREFDRPLGSSLRTTTEEETSANMDHRLSYKWTGERRVHELTTELRYSYDTDDEISLATQRGDTGVFPSTPYQQQVNLDERNTDIEAKLDYISPLWQDARLEAGYAGSSRGIDNDYLSMSDSSGALIPDGQSNAFNFIERMHGLYAIVGQTVGNVDLQIGARAEQVNTEFDLTNTGEVFKNEYFSVFPSALIGYRPSDETQLRLSYSKRISRPRTRALNPFSTSTDPQFKRVGNPYLRPEYTHGVELSINQFVPWGTLQFTPYMRRTVDAIERFERVDSAGVVTATFENLGQVDSYGAELLSTGRFGDWLNTVASVGLFQSVTDATSVGADPASEAFSWSARLTATASLGWGTSLQASAFYRSPSNIVGGHTDAHVMTDIAATKTLLDDRFKIGLRVNDPFNVSGMRSWRETDGYYIETERRWGGRSAMLTFAYLFGKQNESRRERGDGGSDDAGDIDW